MNATTLLGIGAPACLLFSGSVVLFFRGKTVPSFLQLLGAGCLLVVVLAHVSEALHLFPWMQWGLPQSVGHYVDFWSAESQDRQDPRADDPADAIAAGGPGDPIARARPTRPALAGGCRIRHVLLALLRPCPPRPPHLAGLVGRDWAGGCGDASPRLRSATDSVRETESGPARAEGQ